jgi:hypothetical protein
LVADSAITISADGHILTSDLRNVAVAGEENFQSTASDVLGSAHHFILNRGDRWHNDSFSSDWASHLITKSMNSSRLLDPRAPLPSFDEVVRPFNALYSELFAIWVGRNRDRILVSGAQSVITGTELQPTTRIFMSTVMFGISEGILVAYIFVTLLLYIRRPWKILCRLPSDLASVIAYFAASRAVLEMKGTAHLSKKEQALHLARLDGRFGFGSFISHDGMNHLGIEKEPYVASLIRHNVGSSGSDTNSCDNPDHWLMRLRQLKSGKTMEGGWL